MLDALIVDEVSARPGGIRARCGSLVFGLDCPTRDQEALLASESSPLVIWCQLEARDEEFSLAGFASAARRDLYVALREISGIGRRSALAVLDCGEATDILRAVASRDNTFFLAIPGLGPKRIGVVLASLAKKYRGALPSSVGVPVRWIVEAREALVLGGRGSAEAECAVLAELDPAPRSAEDLAGRAREALGNA